MKLQWSPGYSVGDRTLDEDHQQLFALVNAFIDAQDMPTARRTLVGLNQYAKAHFAREEALMAQVGARDLDAHKRQHEGLSAKLNQLLVNQLMAGEVTKEKQVIQSIAALLEAWIFDHVLVCDRNLRATVKSAAERRALSVLKRHTA